MKINSKNIIQQLEESIEYLGEQEIKQPDYTVILSPKQKEQYLELKEDIPSLTVEQFLCACMISSAMVGNNESS